MELMAICGIEVDVDRRRLPGTCTRSIRTQATKAISPEALNWKVRSKYHLEEIQAFVA